MPKSVLTILMFVLLSVLSVGVDAKDGEQVSQASTDDRSLSDSGDKNEKSKNLSDDNDGEELSLDLSDRLSIDKEIDLLNELYRDFLETLGVSSGLIGMLLGTILVIVSFFISKFIVSSLIKSATKFILKQKYKLGLNSKRIHFYRDAITLTSKLILLLVALLITLGIWDINLSWLSTDIIQNFISNLSALFLVLVISILIIELVSGLINRYFDAKDLSGSRTETVKPIAKNSALGFLFFIFGMLALSQLGIDILPLLAGAGVLGVAIGFGAQALVKDVLTGFIVILEDLIQVGDIVTLNDRVGEIERITIRKVQLRNLDGTVYTIPFGEIAIVANHTKHYSYYLMHIGVAYREDVDQVRDTIKELGKDLQNDDEYKDFILDDLEVLGVDQFADSAVIIKARIKTVPKKQWMVGREFNRRMKIRFDELDIEIPFPHQTIYMGQDKSGKSPKLNLNVDNKVDEKSLDRVES